MLAPYLIQQCCGAARLSFLNPARLSVACKGPQYEGFGGLQELC